MPAETRQLRFKMIDRNVPKYPHGGGVVAYTGQSTIPAGSFSYKGPCPPGGAPHIYQWTVEALDATGKIVIGRGTAAARFPM